MTSELKKILKKIRNFTKYFSETNLAPQYTRAWELNKKHGINLNPLSPFSAFILKFIIKKNQPNTILEIGTSGAYSTLQMASALKEVRSNAHIYSIEKSAPKAEIARVHVAEAQKFGINNITLLESDAAEVIKNWDKPIDLLFLDADRKNYLSFLKNLEQHLTPHALIIADNVKSHPEDVKEFIAYMKNSANYQTFIVPFSKGLLVARKK